MSDIDRIEIVDNPDRKRFEARLDGQLAGLVDYIPLPGKIIATHTEVFEAYEGQGVGSRLVSGMIEQLRADGRLLQPQCSYVASYLRRHPDQADVVDRSTPH